MEILEKIQFLIKCLKREKTILLFEGTQNDIIYINYEIRKLSEIYVSLSNQEVLKN